MEITSKFTINPNKVIPINKVLIVLFVPSLKFLIYLRTPNPIIKLVIKNKTNKAIKLKLGKGSSDIIDAVKPVKLKCKYKTKPIP